MHTAAITPFVVTINDWQLGVDPEFVAIIFKSELNGFCSDMTIGNCLYFYLDDLTLTTATGTLGQDELFGEVLIYPNLSSDVVNVTTYNSEVDEIVLRDCTGRIMQRTSISSDQLKLD